MSEHLRAQLIAEKAYFKYDYGSAALDPWLTNQLIGFLESVGISDLRQLAQFKGTLPTIGEDGVSVDYVYTSFYYNAFTGNQITGLRGHEGQMSADALGEDVFATTYNSDYAFTYHCVFPRPGFPIFTVTLRSMHAQFSLREILPVVMIIASLVIPGLALLIGQTALGAFGAAGAELAASFPTIASAIGNTCISAATNGGDIERAVISGFAGFAGGQAGGVLQTATDSEILAKAAAAATSSAITGGDVKMAAGLAALSGGANSLIEYGSSLAEPASTGDIVMDEFVDPYMLDYPTPEQSFIGPMPDSSFVGPMPDFDSSIFDNAPLSVDMSDVNIPTWDGPTVSIAEAGVSTSTDSSGINWDKVINNFGTVAIAALKVLPAFIQAGKPPVRIGSTMTNPDGSTTTIAANGTVTTHYPSGQVKTAPTPVGQPFFTADGSTVTNNGNGTYTVIRADGTSATMRYPSGIGSNPLLLYGALAAGAIFLIRR